MFYFHVGEAGKILSKYSLRNILKEESYITQSHWKEEDYIKQPFPITNLIKWENIAIINKSSRRLISCLF